MSAFVKNYYSPKNPAIFLSVSWETGYRNIQVYYNDRLVHTIKQPTVLEDGVKIKDEELGTIKFRFSTVRPRKLEIKVNNRKYKIVNNFAPGYDYSSLVTVFTTLALFAVIESFILAGMARFDFSYPLVGIFFTLGILITGIYAVIAFLLTKKVNWSYFIGTGIFTITTLASALGVTLILNDFANYFVLIFRLGILVYLYFQMRHILKEIRKSTTSVEDDGLLDS
jgi:hypothetical protein